MATKEDPSFAGRRLADLRRSRGLTAAELAELVPGGLVSKTMITNLESGRKRDLTVTEAVVLAWALDVPVFALLLDTEQPWADVPFADLAPEFAGLTNIEYLRRATTQPRDRAGRRDWEVETAVLDRLADAEAGIAWLDHLDELTALGVGATVTAVLPNGERIVLSWVEPDSVWELINQPIIDNYRRCLEALEWLGYAAPDKVDALPGAVRRRIDAVRRRVVKLIADDEQLDYGQSDDPSAYGTPVLNPSTGRTLDSRRRWSRGAPADPAE